MSLDPTPPAYLADENSPPKSCDTSRDGVVVASDLPARNRVNGGVAPCTRRWKDAKADDNNATDAADEDARVSDDVGDADKNENASPSEGGVGGDMM